MEKYIRLESVRSVVDNMLLSMPDAEERRCAYLHLYGVSQTSSILAIKRDLDPEIAAIIGMLHDYYSYLTGVQLFHGANSAETIRPIIRDMDLFTKEEQKKILRAIFHHSDKKKIHSDYDELIKDADVFQHFLYNINKKVRIKSADRLKNVLKELELPYSFEIEDEINEKQIHLMIDKRNLLGDISENLALKHIVGTPGDREFKEMCRYWPDDNIHKTAKDKWCAIFVYYCCREAGIFLPIRYPKSSGRFGACGNWQEWAKDMDGFYHEADEMNFQPEKGDIVIFEKLLSEFSYDHIGVVLSCDDNYIQVAEGNLDNKNISGTVHRNRYIHVAGYIRIPNDYSYTYNGDY